MRRIVLDMQCAMYADAISQALERSDPDFLILRSESPNDTVSLCRSGNACALIMEVTQFTPWRLEERLKLRNEVKRLVSCCKIVLLADEKSNAALAGAVKQAKKDGLVDNFIFASVSPQLSCRRDRRTVTKVIETFLIEKK